MDQLLTVVLDVGKTLSKASLWDQGGQLIARQARPNPRIDVGAYAALDIEGIEAWLLEVLSGFARQGPISALIPVGHGAAAVIVRDGRPVCAPMDYESPVPESVRQSYLPARDAFALSGSPALPGGLNLGLQLAWLEQLHPGILHAGSRLLLWPQYWAWRLSGVAAAEVSSLGCHTDLWLPAAAQPSHLALTRGWSACLPPLRAAGDVLGKIRTDWARRTGLPADTHVHCGVHDSNAALVAARACPEIAAGDATVLSTGTWFIALRSLDAHAPAAAMALDASRDCLVNVDVRGLPLPSARFMGGREAQLLNSGRALDNPADQARAVAAVPAVLAAGAQVLPGFVERVGPFPRQRGRWIGEPADDAARAAAIALYLALVADTSLELIGAREQLMVEGRFAHSEVFVRALASLRPGTRVYRSSTPEQGDVSFGALRLVHPRIAMRGALQRVRALESDLSMYKNQWHRNSMPGVNA